MNATAKVGLFSFLGLALLGFAVFLLGDFSFKKSYPVFVEFEDVAGLPKKAAVKLSGVEIGRVKDIYIEGAVIVVKILVDDGVIIYKDSVFEVGSTSLIGSKYLQVTQGHKWTGAVMSGDRVKGVTAPPMDKMITNTMTSLKKLLDNFGQNGQLGNELQATMSNLRQITSKVNELVTALKDPVENSMSNIDVTTRQLSAVMDKLDSILARIDSGEGAIGALMADKKVRDDVVVTVQNVKEASGQAKELLTRVGGFKTYWQYAYRSEPQANTSRGDFGLKIVPRQGRYYYLGVSNLGNKKDKRDPKDFVEMNKLNAQLGWEGDNYNLYVGILHGAGGLGLKYAPLYSAGLLGRLWLTGEASDFYRNREILGRQFDKPNYTVGGEVKVTRILNVGARMYDMAETGHMQYNANITLEDKDIAYLLGLVSLGTMGAKGGK